MTLIGYCVVDCRINSSAVYCICLCFLLCVSCLGLPGWVACGSLDDSELDSLEEEFVSSNWGRVTLSLDCSWSLDWCVGSWMLGCCSSWSI